MNHRARQIKAYRADYERDRDLAELIGQPMDWPTYRDTRLRLDAHRRLQRLSTDLNRIRRTENPS